jgi:2-oxo-4-hydroxy-4-carboxy-5-ureidoimidazoline decarboxylase
MTLSELNSLPTEALAEKFSQCCAAPKWWQAMAAKAPFANAEAILAAADAIWATCGEADFLEAFLAHPKIGDVDSLAKKFAATKTWAGNEQALVNQADMRIIEALAKGNNDYADKFGFIFIVFATGKTAEQMLALLVERLPNGREKELYIAAAEQHKITRLRIEKLLA